MSKQVARQEWVELARRLSKEVLDLDDFTTERKAQEFADRMQVSSSRDALKTLGEFLGIDPMEIKRKQTKIFGKEPHEQRRY